MTDKEIVENIRTILDTGFSTKTKGVIELLMEQADVLDKIEAVLGENNYPSTLTTEYEKI